MRSQVWHLRIARRTTATRPKMCRRPPSSILYVCVRPDMLKFHRLTSPGRSTALSNFMRGFQRYVSVRPFKWNRVLLFRCRSWHAWSSAHPETRETRPPAHWAFRAVRLYGANGNIVYGTAVRTRLLRKRLRKRIRVYGIVKLESRHYSPQNVRST